MARQARDPLPSDTPWVFRRITRRPNVAGRQARFGAGPPPGVTSPRARRGRKPEPTAERWSRWP
jgi:hypothetical protein